MLDVVLAVVLDPDVLVQAVDQAAPDDGRVARGALIRARLTEAGWVEGADFLCAS